MNSTRQVLRWSLPGLVFVLNALVFHGLWLGLVEHQSPWKFVNEASAPALVAVVAGGLPVGFLVYQIYFHNYRPIGRLFFALGGRAIFYRRDRGGGMIRMFRDRFSGNDKLLEFVEGNRLPADVEDFVASVQDPQLKKHCRLFMWPADHLKSSLDIDHPDVSPRICPKCHSIYTKRSDQNWLLIQTAIDVCSGSKAWIKAEYTSGSDLYHGLGASRTAVWLGAGAVLAYDLVLRPLMRFDPTEFRHADALSIALVIVTAVVLAWAETFVYWKCRDQLESSYERRVAAGVAMASREIYG